MDIRTTPRTEQRWRLRSGADLVGYMRELPSGLRLYARDRLYWTGTAIDHDARDPWSGLRDADRHFVFDGDVVHVGPLDAAGEHPQWVVVTGPLRLQSLDGSVERPLVGENGAPLYDRNELRIVTHVWHSAEIQRLRGRPGDEPGADLPVEISTPLVHLVGTAAALATGFLITGAMGLFWMLLGQVAGAWPALRSGRRRSASFLGRRHVRRLSVRTGIVHGAAAAFAYAGLFLFEPSAFEFSAIHLLWTAPAIGLLVGLPALVSFMLVGDVMAHRDGGYADE